MIIKRLGKLFLCVMLERQVKKLRQNNKFAVIAVVGSVGKTTTKLAIAAMLQPQVRLRYQAGNYNDRLTVPLVFFGQDEPNIFDIRGWLKVLKANKQALQQAYSYDVVLLELGSDAPGQMKYFAYTKPDILVVTALTDEHMLYFKTLDAVAAEELTATSFSKQVLVNVDDSPAHYLSQLTYKSYGQQGQNYQLRSQQQAAHGVQILGVSSDGRTLSLTSSLLGLSGAKSVLAAAAVADMYGMNAGQIEVNSSLVTAVPGRMQLLPGIQDATIIDDSYNASPVAMKSALDVLYAMPANQRIAVLGNMNEMGELSVAMHQEVGNYCDPAKLSFVVTIGPDANQHLAPAALAKGCQVKTFDSPYAAGEFIATQLQPNAAILVKGSQNGVFSEETVKVLLADPADAAKLVRQSDFWLKKKQAQFTS